MSSSSKYARHLDSPGLFEKTSKSRVRGASREHDDAILTSEKHATGTKPRDTSHADKWITFSTHIDTPSPAVSTPSVNSDVYHGSNHPSSTTESTKLRGRGDAPMPRTRRSISLSPGMSRRTARGVLGQDGATTSLGASTRNLTSPLTSSSKSQLKNKQPPRLNDIFKTPLSTVASERTHGNLRPGQEVHAANTQRSQLSRKPDKARNIFNVDAMPRIPGVGEDVLAVNAFDSRKNDPSLSERSDDVRSTIPRAVNALPSGNSNTNYNSGYNNGQGSQRLTLGITHEPSSLYEVEDQSASSSFSAEANIHNAEQVISEFSYLIAADPHASNSPKRKGPVAKDDTRVECHETLAAKLNPSTVYPPPDLETVTEAPVNACTSNSDASQVAGSSLTSAINQDAVPNNVSSASSVRVAIHESRRIDLQKASLKRADRRKQMPTAGNDRTKPDIKVEMGPNGIIVADSETVRWLEQYCIVSLTQQQRDRIEEMFSKLDSDQDGLLLPLELFQAIQNMTRNRFTSKQFEYLMHLLEFTPLNTEDTRATLVLTPGMFTLNPEDCLTIALNFDGVPYKTYVLVVTLAQRIVNANSAIHTAIGDLEVVHLSEKLNKIKKLFYFQVHENNNTTLSLDELSIEIKSAGTVSRTDEDAILGVLQADNVQQMTFLDFLAYMPLFLKIHDSILSNPLEMQRQGASISKQYQ